MASISSLGIGSGMDLNGLLDQLAAAERQKLTPITAQKSSYNAKISAFGKLESALDKFQQAAAKLNGTDAFRAVKSNVTGEALSAAADTTAVAGTYKISVSHLAQAHSLASGGVDKKDAPIMTEAGDATLEITLGSSTEPTETLSITLSKEDSSLESIRDAINAQEAGVTASIINTGATDMPYQLVLTSKKTGTDSSIVSIDVTGSTALQDKFAFNDPEATTNGNDPEATTNGMTETVAAQSAKLKINNIDITSQSNRVEEAIQGVTLDITQLVSAESPETLTISQDSEAIGKNVQSFVDAYNNLKSTMDSLTSYDADSGTAGKLLGDNTMRSVETNLRRVMTGSLGEGGLQMLSDVGIELQLDGKLEIDSDKLDGLIAESPESLSRFFGGTEESDGFADQLDSALSAMLDDKGLITNATEGLEDRISSLDERYARVESSINATIARYRAQFADMDMLVSEMNSTMSYLSQQFDAMNAQLGRD